MDVSNHNHIDNNKISVLWISPNFNHYKARLLNHLTQNENIELSVLTGEELSNEGHKNIDQDWYFDKYNINIPKSKFGYSRVVRKWFSQHHSSYKWIMIPREKKNILLFLYLMYIRYRRLNSKYELKLFSYNHPISTSNRGKSNRLDMILTRFFYRFYDKVIFYTEEGRNKMVELNLINSNKAFWANNTIDTSEVNKHYKFVYPNFDNPTILFIGRLIKTKNFDILLEYYHRLKSELKDNGKSLKLYVIGDGPEITKILEAQKNDTSIYWLGSIVDEKLIAQYMTKANFIFVPGHSGLSINHALAYGRPYVTFDHDDHPPEIDYLVNGQNGYILKSNFEENIDLLSSFLLVPKKNMYDSAYYTGQNLSPSAWCDHIVNALKTKN